MTPEDRFVTRIFKTLKEYPGWWHKTPRTRFGKSGTPDILGCFFGRFIAVEVKRPDGVGNYGVTKLQQLNLDTITIFGGWSFVVNDDVSYQAFLSKLGEAWNIKDPPGWTAHCVGR